MHRFKFLILILILGCALRLFALGEYNPGFFRDESAIAYNAYSIWETGKDEYGYKFPIVFRSFEVFFMPLYIYLLAPIVGIFGLTEFNARLLSAISGILAILAVYLITLKIWKKDNLALTAAFILAISPWHILYSRGTFEGNLGLTLFAFGFFYLLKFIEKNTITNLCTTIFLFILSMYSYQSERVVAPLLALTAFALLFKKILLLKTKLIIPILLSIFLMLPILSLSLQPGSYDRARNVSIFSRESTLPSWVDNHPEELLTNNTIYLRARQIVALYLSYFSPRSLFFEGDANLQRGVDNFSVFYASLFPGLILGIVLILKDKRKEIFLLVAWILFAPIPAALTSDPFHTYRSLLLYFPLTILIATGLLKILEKFKFAFVAISVILFVNLSLFLYSYFALTPASRAKEWDYGYKQIVEFLNTQTDYSKVVIDDQQTESYINYLFFSKTNPEAYHKSVAELGPLNNYYYSSAEKIRPDKVNSIYFRKVDWPSERGDDKTIFIFPAERLFPSEFETDPKIKLIKEIYYPDKTVAFRILKITNPKAP